MLGAIAGDIIGSIYEKKPLKTTKFPLFSENSTFTDDTVMTIAVAESLLFGESYETTFKKWGNKYPNAGYGSTFKKWLKGEIAGAYNSWGNGGAMRVSPIGYLSLNLKEILEEAEKSASVTHNHPEGIKGAKAVAGSIHLALKGHSKEEIKAFNVSTIGYDMKRTIDDIRPNYKFDVSSQGSVPESIICFLEAKNVEDAIRKAVSLGGDSDTMASIAGAIAEAFYKNISSEISTEVPKRLPKEILDIWSKFEEKYY